jgi:hypothetical protein
LAKASYLLFGGVKFPILFFGRSGARIPGSAAVVGPASKKRPSVNKSLIVRSLVDALISGAEEGGRVVPVLFGYEEAVLCKKV